MPLSGNANATITAFNSGYKGTEDGHVLSPTGRVGKLVPVSNGYLAFSVNVNGKHRTIRVHQLQAYQLYGASAFQPGVEVRHLNNDKLDNSAANIGIGTHAANEADKDPNVRAGAIKLAVLAAAEFNRKLTNTEVRELRTARASGVPLRILYERYGITQSAVCAIANRRCYKHIT